MPDEPAELIGTTEAMAILALDRSTLVRWIQLGKLTPVTRLGPTGAYVFDAADIRALGVKLAAEAEAKTASDDSSAVAS